MKALRWMFLIVLLMPPGHQTSADSEVSFEIRGLTHTSHDAFVYGFHGIWKLTMIDTVECYLDGNPIPCQRTRIATVTYDLGEIRTLQNDFDRAFRAGVSPDIRRVPDFMSDEQGTSHTITPKEEEAVRAFIEVVSQKCCDAYLDVISSGDRTRQEAYFQEWRVPQTSLIIAPICREYPWGRFDVDLEVVFDVLPSTANTQCPEP